VSEQVESRSDRHSWERVSQLGTTYYYEPAVKIVCVIAKRVVKFNCHNFEANKPISEQKDHKAVRKITASIRHHDKGDREDIKE
jgi:hypothetical protein